ncbi:hypothetical protein P389DRAFT_12350 [Cystobasidium minutum MCA 4210]|uniref:uncharacterized protein n=1 Tax=Cystobasidium minutum MCA 4210 TaxID=1397322 RepID=UPI0034CF85ED|eukprot:jgi/Rhomi1/12350/CE12349_41
MNTSIYPLLLLLPAVLHPRKELQMIQTRMLLPLLSRRRAAHLPSRGFFTYSASCSARFRKSISFPAPSSSSSSFRLA